MKKIILALLVAVPVLLQAQNYTNICSAGPTFYSRMNTNVVKAYKTTSYTLPGNSDTIFYSFATLRDTAADCKDTTKGSILGRKVYRKSVDYLFYFFNKMGDTIYINSKAVLNDTWRFTKLSSGTFLEAKVVSVGQDSVMGVMDDVMKIELSAKRNDGLPISSPWNGKYLKLSKHYGLSRTFDMNNVPFDTTWYVLRGKLKPVIGLQDFGWREVYSYNLGDQFHYSGYSNSYTGSPNTTWKEIQTVITKTAWGTAPDSVVYKLDRCRSTITNPGNTLVYERDTITVKYKFNVMANDSTIMRYPDQFKRQNFYASQYDRYMKLFNNRQTKKITEDKYRFLNNCWVVPTGSVTIYRSYSEGLGLTEFYLDDSNTQDFYRLVYFKKGSETWGNLVGTECSPALAVDDQAGDEAPSVKIVPNPVRNQATVMIRGIKTTGDLFLSVYNIVGKEVNRIRITGETTILERKNLPTGIYLYRITGRDTDLTGKFMIE